MLTGRQARLIDDESGKVFVFPRVLLSGCSRPLTIERGPVSRKGICPRTSRSRQMLNSRTAESRFK